MFRPAAKPLFCGTFVMKEIAVTKPEESATTGADLLVKALIDEEVEVVFGYPGGAVLPIYDSLFKQNRLRHILVRHEQAAVHAAEGYARSTGRSAWCW
jgi:acetolactate synthase-1/2/3 large subunit